MIYAHDDEPALFRQTSVGHTGRTFTILKFRSMRQDDSESHSGEVTSRSEEGNESARACFRTTQPDDPRITAVGRVIRKTHLDELPLGDSLDREPLPAVLFPHAAQDRVESPENEKVLNWFGRWT